MMGGRRLLGSLVIGLLIMACCPVLNAVLTEATSSTPKPTTASPEKPTAAPTPSPTTAASTTTTTSTTTAATATQRPGPEIGSSCNSSNGDDTAWCNNITGEAQCINNKCSCAASFFPFNQTVCLNVSVLNPTGLKISLFAKNTLCISWELNNEVRNIIKNITVAAEKQFSGFNSTPCTVESGNTKAKCEGLTPGCSYKVTVAVDVGQMNGSNSETTNMELSKPGPLIKTDEFVAPNVTLTWMNGSDPSECVSGYHVIVKKDSSVAFQGTTRNATPHIMTIGLAAGTNYTTEIISTNGQKNSTAAMDWFRTNTARPSMPQNLNWTELSEAIELTWSEPEKPNGVIKNYTVCYYFKHYNDSNYSDRLCSSTSDATTAFNLTNDFAGTAIYKGTFYNISVQAWNEDFLGQESVIEIRTNQSTPGAVSNLNATSTDETITVSWTRPDEPNGDIVAYKLNVSNTSMCEIVLNVTESNITWPCSTDSTYNKSANSLPLALNQKQMNVTLSGLKPDTNYTLYVMAYTEAGIGEIKNITVKTQIAFPGPVRNVSVPDTGITASNVSVTWVIPERKPGPVTYLATARSIVPVNVSVPDRSCIKEGYESNSCVIDGLEAFWVYNVSVIASTDAGRSPESESITFTTKPSMPGMVSDVTVHIFNDTSDRNACDATKIKIMWTEPDILVRNDNITMYMVVELDGKNIKRIEVPAKPYEISSRSYNATIEGLTAARPYEWQIYAVGNLHGEEKEFAFETKQCAPPPWSNESHGNVTLTASTPNSVTVMMAAKFFEQSRQGTITNSGLIISKETQTQNRRRRSTPVISVEAATTWKKASENQFVQPYRISFSVLNFVNGMIKVEIGSEICTGLDTEYCNGELPPSTQFWVYPFACTSVLCTVGTRFGPFATQPTPTVPPTNNGWIVGICLAIVFAAVICAFALLWYRGVINPAKWTQRFRGRRGSSDSDFEPIDDTDRSIQIAKYSEVLEELHRDTNLLLSNQYEDIKKKGAHIEAHTSSEASNLEPNKGKNRWVNILPFDHSRVKIQQLDDEDPTTDYINANYIPGFHHKREYIATQGPLPGTIDDFWSMIWEHQVKIIVMLTLCKEGQRVKCEKYWPDEVNEPKQYGEVVVNPTSMSNMDKFDINIFTLSHGEESMKQRVTQFHYLTFPDFSADVEFEHFIEFVRTVRSHVPHNMKEPMVIHCSAGVGRTGTYIAVDYLQEYLNSPKFNLNDRVNIFDFVMKMRENRVNMVQTESQYIMIHDCFESMLEDKKKSLEARVSVNDVYVNEAFGEQVTEPDEHQYENVNMEKKEDVYANVADSNGQTNSEENTEL